MSARKQVRQITTIHVHEESDMTFRKHQEAFCPPNLIAITGAPQPHLDTNANPSLYSSRQPFVKVLLLSMAIKIQESPKGLWSRI